MSRTIKKGWKLFTTLLLFAAFVLAGIPGAVSVRADSSTVQNFSYTGSVQSVTLPAGQYKLEVWGAQGGTGNPSANVGGKGGYSAGNITLKKETTLYVYVGQAGSNAVGSATFGGGGRADSSCNYDPGQGGGASDIRIGQDSLYARAVVAGGGGGGAGADETFFIGGYGGGLTSGSTSANSNGAGDTVSSAGQTYAGASTDDSYSGLAGDFGIGAAYTGGGTRGGGGGGGGWYGGGAGSYGTAGSGGSGYVYTSSTASNYPSGCLLTSDYYLTDAQTIAGNTSFPSVSGGTETGHSGNGYARITSLFNAKLTFNANGSTFEDGTTSNATTYADLSSGYKVPKNKSDSQVFDGWSETAGGTVVYKTAADIPNTKDLTLYAHYSAGSVLTFNAGDGNFSDGTKNNSVNVVSGGVPINTYAEPTPPSEKDFIGWSTTSGSKTAEYTTLASVPKTKALTLYAVYKDWVSLTFDAGDGKYTDDSSTSKVEKYDKNGELKTSSVGNPEKSGYDFIGWSDTKDGAVKYTSSTASEIPKTADKTFYAVYKIYLKLTFHAGRGTFSTGDFKTNVLGYHNSDSLVNAGDLATGEYYDPSCDETDFMGWATTEDGEVTYTDLSSIPKSKDLDLYAVFKDWSVITFHSGDGTFADSKTENVLKYDRYQNLKTGSYANPEANDSSKLFNGWSTSEGGDVAYFNNYPKTADLDLYAVYDTPYVVTYHSNGSTFSDGEDANVVKFNKNYSTGASTGRLKVGSYKTPTTPSGGYFSGWSKTKDGDILYTSEGQIPTNETMDLYARWDDVTYNVNGGTFASGKTENKVQYAGQTTVTGTYEEPTGSPEGKGEFLGWSTNKDSTSAQYKSEDSVPKNSSSLTLYAVYTPRYKVTFDANGGKFAGGTTNIVEYQSGKVYSGEYASPESTDSRHYGEFIGWSAEKTGKAAYKSEDKVPKNQTMTLYAQYLPRYTITFNANGGKFGKSETNSILYEKGEDDTVSALSGTYTIPSSPDGKGAFKGWSTTKDGEAAITDEKQLSFTTDTTLYAVYQQVYTTTYHAGSGSFSGKDENVLKYNEDGTTYSGTYTEPKRAGYLFSGWADEEGADGAKYFTESDVKAKNGGDVYAVYAQNDTGVDDSGNVTEQKNNINVVKYNAKNEPINGTYAEPEKNDGGTFAGWSLTPDGDVVISDDKPNNISNAFLNAITNGSVKRLYAKWSYGTKVKYAVSVYGIDHDLDKADGSKYSNTVTFGPAQGSYVTAEKPAHVTKTSETDSNKCIHNHTWSEIIEIAKTNPHAFDQCLTNGCTKTVELQINDTLISDKNTVSEYFDNETGDGPGQLIFELNDQWRIWNPRANYSGASSNEQSYGTNRGGWPLSRLRAVLNGSEALGGDYTYANGALKGWTRGTSRQNDDGSNRWNNWNGDQTVDSIATITSSNCLLSCFPSELKAAIIPKAVQNSRDTVGTAGSTQTTYDKLWLTSLTEQHNQSGYGGSYYSGRGNSSSYIYYAYSGGAASGSSYCWLRSPSQGYACNACCSSGSSWYDSYTRYGSRGVAPGFVIGQ